MSSALIDRIIHLGVQPDRGQHAGKTEPVRSGPHSIGDEAPSLPAGAAVGLPALIGDHRSVSVPDISSVTPVGISDISESRHIVLPVQPVVIGNIGSGATGLLGINPITADRDKAGVIEKVFERDRHAFDNWLLALKSSSTQTLDLPKEALRYLLIPRRILEIAEDPSGVDIVISDQSPTNLEAYILEHKAVPVSRFASLESNPQQGDQLKYEAEIQSETGALLLQKHRSLTSNDQVLDEEGLLMADSLISNFVNLSIYDKRFLTVGVYQDRAHLRGIGIGKSFFSRLQDAARKMGFGFIILKNNGGNIGYFRDVIGGYPLDQIRPEFLPAYLEDTSEFHDFTVFILDSGDKEKYLNKK
jgi:hypothetical protein